MLNVCDTMPCRLAPRCAISKLNAPDARVRDAEYLHYTAPEEGEDCVGFVDLLEDEDE